MARSYSAGPELDRVQFLLTEEDFGTLLKSTLKADTPASRIPAKRVSPKDVIMRKTTQAGAGAHTLYSSL